MVCRERLGPSTGRRSSRGRGLFAASASGSSSIPRPVATGSGEFTPPPPRVPGSGEFTSPSLRVPEAEDAISLQEGGGSFYESTLQELTNSYLYRAIIDSRCHSRGQHAHKWEKELKQPPTFQEVFDKTNKKKGTDQYISDKARAVVESYSQQMTEKYAREKEQPQLDPEVWVAASGTLKKGHVYGFGHSMDMSRLLFGASSSTSQTSAFTTPGAPGTSPSEMMDFIQDEISGLESRLAQTMQMQVSDTVQAHLF
ncbi:hypothetical protein Taro_034973 [Colocasia esculenta]|uniref:Uncharacterized protein n=1 Tax=Colocasia esculenta TaxID=4460 RepID=A0A843W4F1_COLES|nr:hypothetical protein [Colocasia esculenta]